MAFVVGYARLEDKPGDTNDRLWKALDSVMAEVPGGDHPLVLIVVSAHPSKGDGGCKTAINVLGTHGHD